MEPNQMNSIKLWNQNGRVDGMNGVGAELVWLRVMGAAAPRQGAQRED